MLKSFFGLRKRPVYPGSARALAVDDAEQVTGGRMKIPGGSGGTVYYDDGISVLTSNPATSNM